MSPRTVTSQMKAKRMAGTADDNRKSSIDFVLRAGSKDGAASVRA